jgi:hypothetical protein
METVELLNKLYEKLSPSKINPTVIFNEGWMTRLLVTESMKKGIVIGNINFGNLAKKEWSSEALISSPFIGIEKNPEGYTHADIILGDFEIDYSNRGDIKVKSDAQILGIIEAKMRSNLSKSTSNAKEYNQASRNICCLAYNAAEYATCKTFFIVAAPKVTIEKYKFSEQMDKVPEQIEQRFRHSGKEKDYSTKLKDKVNTCERSVICYEDWIEFFEGDSIKRKLEDFYKKCKECNRISE